MEQIKVLTSRFNLSLGFLPIAITLILAWFIDQATALYIGTGVGLACCVMHKRTVCPFILYSTTGVLSLFSVGNLLIGEWCPPQLFPLMAEIGVLVPPLIIFANRKRLARRSRPPQEEKKRRLFLIQGMEASIVSARVVIIISSLHFFMLIVAVILGSPLGNKAQFFWFKAAPPGVFLLTIAINQLGIIYFNRLVKRLTFIPVITEKGEVTGRETIQEATTPDNHHLHPMVRIAVASHGMLYLLPRPQALLSESGKTDLLMESYVLYGESVKQCTERMLRKTCPAISTDKLHFNLTYHYEQDSENRLVYLFTLDLDNDESLLCCDCIKGGKLWTLSQIEDNLGKNFFSCYLEYEYEYLKDIICTREIYKVS